MTPTGHSLRAWRNAVFLVFTLSGLALATWVARIPAVRDGLAINTAELGGLIFGLSAGAVAGLVAAPAVLSRLGARRSMQVLIVVLALGIAVTGLGENLFSSFAATFFGLVLFGVGNGAIDVVMNLEGALVEKAMGRTVLPLMHAFFSFGTLLGAGIGAAASALSIPVGWHFVAITLVIIASGVPAMRYVPSLPAEESKRSPGTLTQRLRANARVWRDPRLVFIGLIMLGMAFTEGSAMDWIAVAAVDGHHVSNTLGAVVLGVFVAGMVVGRVLGGPLIDRFGRVLMIRGSALVGAAGIALFIFAPVSWLAIVGTAIWAVGCSLGFPVGISAAADERDGADSASAAARVSAVSIIGYLAFLVGPPLIGWLGELFGILNALLVVLGLLVIAAVCAPAARESSGQFARRTGHGNER